jgi:hypothetical protein
MRAFEAFVDVLACAVLEHVARAAADHRIDACIQGCCARVAATTVRLDLILTASFAAPGIYCHRRVDNRDGARGIRPASACVHCAGVSLRSAVLRCLTIVVL